LLADAKARAQRSERACILFGNLFGIAGSTSEIRCRIFGRLQKLINNLYSKP
jgi:hypothetical protein